MPEIQHSLMTGRKTPVGAVLQDPGMEGTLRTQEFYPGWGLRASLNMLPSPLPQAPPLPRGGCLWG